MVNQVQATLARMESTLINLENDRCAYNYHNDGVHYIKHLIQNIEKQGEEIEEFKIELDATTFKQEDNVDWKPENAKEKEGKMDIEDMDLTSNKRHHSLDLMNVPKEACRSSKENYIVPVDSRKEPVILIPYNDFVWGDQQWKL